MIMREQHLYYTIGIKITFDFFLKSNQYSYVLINYFKIRFIIRDS